MDINISSIKTSIPDVASNEQQSPLAKEQAIDVNESIKEFEKTEASDKSISASSDNKVTQEQLLSAIDVVSSFLEPQIRNVNFTQHESSGKTIVKVFDTQSKELIRQFPSNELLDLAEKIKGLQTEVASKTGILIDDKV